MAEHFLVNLASIVVLGVGAQWVAWRLGMPSILLLLVVGFLAGPVSGILVPDELFGNMLFPFVSLSVAIILFEGGMSLQLSELQGTGHVVRNLVTIGALVTWLIIAGAAIIILGFSPALAALVAAILVVTGPTVIGPLLRVVRPSGQVRAILKWEGIVIDPVGATLSVLVFGAIVAGEVQAATAEVVEGVVRTILDGGALGALGAGAIILLLRRYLVPDFLQSPVVLMVVIAVFTGSNILQAESGLLAVTVMGIILGNQNIVVVKQILNFKENLRVLLIGGLFVLLTARLELSKLAALGWESLIFLGVVMLVARPLSVFLSTLGSDLNWRERIFLAWMAPRGIVAASVSSLFALEMAEAGVQGAERIIPVTFMVIAGTVCIYSMTSVPLARWLGISRPHPQGILIVGAHTLARTIGLVLQKHGYEIILVDTNPFNAQQARAAGLPTFQGSALADDLREDIVLAGVGRLLAMTPNDEVNALTAMEWAEIFDRAEVYQLPPHRANDGQALTTTPALRGRPLFKQGATYEHLMERLSAGARIETTIIAPEQVEHPTRRRQAVTDNSIPLFMIGDDGALIIITADRPVSKRPGRLLISLTDTPLQPEYQNRPELPDYQQQGQEHEVEERSV